MFSRDKEFNLEIDNSINDVIDEANGGNSFIALRKLRWDDTSAFKLDLRKWYTNKDGEEVAGKGVSFISEEGPTNLIKSLLEHGYGDTEETIKTLSARDDFIDAMSYTINLSQAKEIVDKIENRKDEDKLEGLFYDPREIIGA